MVAKSVFLTCTVPVVEIKGFANDLRFTLSSREIAFLKKIKITLNDKLIKKFERNYSHGEKK